MGERLMGRVALVLGAGSSGPGWGNGKAAAVSYSREGASVVAVDIVESAAAETVGLIEDEGGNALAVGADVTSSEQIVEAVRLTIERFGTIDILHNNVGVTLMGDVTDIEEGDWDAVLATNLKSVFLAAKHVLPHMIARRSGVITNVSSIAAIRHTGLPYPAYSASKAAVNQLTVALALDHAADGIRVNAILAGAMNTPMIYSQIAGRYGSAEEMVAARDAATPMGRMGSAWDVAAAAVFLASDEASYITAVCLPVDGGLSARCL